MFLIHQLSKDNNAVLVHRRNGLNTPHARSLVDKNTHESAKWMKKLRLYER